MKLTIAFKHLEHTQSLDEKIKLKSKKLKKYFEGNIDVQWTCYVEDTGSHCADIKLLGPNFEYHATGSADSLYKSLDIVIAKIEKQIVKKKSKWRNKINRSNFKTIKYSEINRLEQEELSFQEQLENEKLAA